MDSTNRIYANIDSGAYNGRWTEKPMPSGSKKRKWIAIGLVLAVVGVVAIGVGVGVTVAKNHAKSSSSASSGSSVVNQTDPNDPSTFTKDSRLKQAFYGLAYTPEGSQLPDCGNNLSSVITDIQLISQLTTRIRLYGADCNQSALVLEAIKQTKTNLTVWLGNYNVPTDNHAAYKRQRDVIKEAIQTYGTDHIGGVTVGNEFMLNYLDANGATDPNSDVGNTGAAILKQDIEDTKQMLSDMGVSLQVGNAEAGSYFNTLVLEDVDYGMSNVHPWFADTTIDDAAGWTYEFFQEQNVEPAAALSNKPQMYIAETGWPTASSNASTETNGASAASIPNLQTFLDTFVCQANNNGTGYFFFEYFDEKWKDEEFGGVEGWWGLFNANKTLKDGLTIPDCTSP
ncbi:glycoside hydrolase family 17 protein [Punctularia strigosozonata HHB-11173 SS5]|uniref:glycoside hydrolase family 17 protein n=1 Tax=Punctularia strigosozonata (strain HHB-11173) TaxID=741275 RepID=UPI000441713D|nr:glycoside hydrolase family 17 protein [Punctularia strigosozonata HHB-11173 SS5]EIN10059.1 glycoside hydrolase family 17 protein [Punctularia strigosozonata HHB-11173 SS5]